MPGAVRMSKLELVVHQNDVRRFFCRRAGFVSGRPQAFGGDRIGLHKAVREQLGDRVDAGAGEGRHLVAAIERLERLQRQMRLDRREPADAGEQRRHRSQSADAERIGAPRNTTSGTSAMTHSETIQRNAGKIVNRKLTVSVSMIMRSTKFAVIISTWYLRSESSTNTVIITSDSDAGDGRPAGEREPEEIQDAPGQQKCRDLDRSVFGREHDGESDDVRDENRLVTPKPAAGEERRASDSLAEGQEGATHDGRARARP